MVKSFKELVVWQKAVSFVTEIYKTSHVLPESEKFGLIQQIHRSSVSIPANIAEGWGRGSTKEYIQFLNIARASLMELETHLIISNNLNYLCEEDILKLQKEIEVIGKMLNKLISQLKKTLPPNP